MGACKHLGSLCSRLDMTLIWMALSMVLPVCYPAQPVTSEHSMLMVSCKIQNRMLIKMTFLNFT